MARRKRDPFTEESITIEDNKVFMWIGPPHHFSSSKIDVTMAFKIGMAIGAKEYDSIDHKEITVMK